MELGWFFMHFASLSKLLFEKMFNCLFWLSLTLVCFDLLLYAISFAGSSFNLYYDSSFNCPCHLTTLLPENKVLSAPKSLCTGLCVCRLIISTLSIKFFTSLQDHLISLLLPFVKFTVLFHLVLTNFDLFCFRRYDSTCLRNSATLFSFFLL